MDIFVSVVSMIFMLVVFLVVLYGAYIASKTLANMQYGKNTKKNIKIIESVAISQGKMLQIIEVSGEHLLIGSTKDSMTYIKTLDRDKIVVDEDRFENHFTKYLKKQKDKVGK